MSTLAIVPARSGSKGVPGKNVRLLAGRTLLDYAAKAARASGVVDRMILSTDSDEIAEAGRRAGLEVPFMRPPDLARDETPMRDVVKHALAEVGAAGKSPAFVVLLQPTSPLRTGEHIRRALELLEERAADSVVSVVEVPRHLSPDYVMRIDDGVLRPFLPEGAAVSRRQDARAAYVRDGTVYAFRRESFDRYGDIYGRDCRPLVVDASESLSIDSPDDWARAERILSAGAGVLPTWRTT